MKRVLHALLRPARLWSREEVLSRPSPVPAAPGIYGWYFRDIPPRVPTDDCVDLDGMKLLYIGISPNGPPKHRGKPSTQNLRRRIRTHYRGDASRSTLRLSLGCLLADILEIELRRHGALERLHFVKDGEGKLSTWMARNAFVVWHVHDAPWEVEASVIAKLSLPLNLKHNANHAFVRHISAIRCENKHRAKTLSPTIDRNH
jgi:GIY-YIG catalytic domain-containing protein